MERFNSLMDEGRYRMAEEGPALQAQEIDPGNPVFNSATVNSRMIGNYRDVMAVRVAAEKAFIDTLYTVERSHVPFPDDPPIVYPDAEVWQQLTARRKERYESMDLATHGPAEKKITAALKSPTQVDFIETPLQDVIDFLKDYHGIEIQIDTKALNDVGIDPTTPITKNLKGISLRSALKLILREFELTYVIQDEVLLITTPEEAETQPVDQGLPRGRPGDTCQTADEPYEYGWPGWHGWHGRRHERHGRRHGWHGRRHGWHGHGWHGHGRHGHGRHGHGWRHGRLHEHPAESLEPEPFAAGLPAGHGPDQQPGRHLRRPGRPEPYARRPASYPRRGRPG